MFLHASLVGRTIWRSTARVGTSKLTLRRAKIPEFGKVGKLRISEKENESLLLWKSEQRRSFIKRFQTSWLVKKIDDVLLESINGLMKVKLWSLHMILAEDLRIQLLFKRNHLEQWIQNIFGCSLGWSNSEDNGNRRRNGPSSGAMVSKKVIRKEFLETGGELKSRKETCRRWSF